jgi:hypothetical protein
VTATADVPPVWVYVVRDDLDAAAPDRWRRHPLWSRLRANFLEALCDALKAAVAVPEPGATVVVKTVGIDEQVEAYLAFEKMLAGSCHAVSLDCFVAGAHRLGVSRVFLCDEQRFPVAVVERPGTDSLTYQIARLPAGDLVLVDDDIASGATMRFVSNAVTEARGDVKVVGWHSLLSGRTIGWNDDRPSVGLLESAAGVDVLDVVDARDFCEGASHSGLLVFSGGVLSRVPYHFEGVNLATRATLDPARHGSFRAAVQAANRVFSEGMTS